jgi:hypothetical protein
VGESRQARQKEGKSKEHFPEKKFSAKESSHFESEDDASLDG